MKKNVKIKVIGVGGSGCNAITRMMKCHIQGVDLIALNTDAQDLKNTNAHQKLQIGKESTKGLGAGMNPEIGKQAAEEQKQEIQDILKDSDMVFIAYGAGGGTGTGAGPVVADIAKKLGILTIAVVTKPFSFEGAYRMKAAEKGIDDLKSKVDTLLVIPNNKLLKLINEETSLLQSFWICDEVLRQAVQGISDLIVLPGIINVDFADLKAIMRNSGQALFGMGKSKGEKRAVEAAVKAISSPLVDFSIEGAKGVLFNVSGGADLSLTEVDEIAKLITQRIHSKAKVIFGAVQDRRLGKGEIRVTVIATGFVQ
ncbi:cell division protein FtsZ [Candidatus Parcubacteria bacterium]|nr:cell division protein FtsZ [Candidatus Parcubacteria bacterium]